MPIFSPWASAGDSLSGLGQSIGGVLLQRKLMELQQQRFAQEMGLQQQQLELQRAHQAAQLPLIGAQTREAEAHIPLFGAQAAEARARIPGIEQQGLGEELKNIMLSRTRGNADIAGQAAQLQAALRTPGLPPAAMQPAASGAINLLQQNDMLPQAGAQPAYYPVSSIAQLLGALMTGRQTAEATTAPAVAGRMAEPMQMGPSQTLVAPNTWEKLFTTPPAQKQFGFRAEPWGTYNADTGDIGTLVPKEFRQADPMATGSAQLSALARKLALGEDLTPEEQSRWADLLRISQGGGASAPQSGGVPTFASEKDIPPGFKGEAIINGRRARVD